MLERIHEIPPENQLPGVVPGSPTLDSVQDVDDGGRRYAVVKTTGPFESQANTALLHTTYTHDCVEVADVDWTSRRDADVDESDGNWSVKPSAVEGSAVNKHGAEVRMSCT